MDVAHQHWPASAVRRRAKNVRREKEVKLNRVGKHLVVLLAFFAVEAQAQKLPPWDWTLSDRIKMRVDAEQIARRASVNASEFQKIPRARAPKFVINGQHNPELFLPSELMAYLLSAQRADAKTRNVIRESYRPWLAYFGWTPESFWYNLENAARAYLDQQSNNSTVLTEVQNLRMCASRAAALAAARQNPPRRARRSRRR